MKQKREIIKFVADTPVSITLDTDPSKAKSYTKNTDWGVKTSYSYFTTDEKVFFASEALHKKLEGYAKGDTVVITLVDGKVWSVSSSSERKTSNIQKDLDQTETVVLLRQIVSDIQEIKNHLYGSRENKREYPKDDISF